MENKEKIIYNLERFLPKEELGKEYAIGFADLKDLLSGNMSTFRYCLVIGKRLDSAIIDSIQEGPNQQYYELYNNTNNVLLDLLQRLSASLDNEGITNKIIKPTGISKDHDNYDQDTLTYYFSHKMAATRAGLGWIGKYDLLVSKKFGPRVRFASLLIKAPLAITEKPIDRGRCGSCQICVLKCPAGAASGAAWNIHIHRDTFFDAHACMKKCRELSLLNLRTDITICGICIKVCPIGK